MRSVTSSLLMFCLGLATCSSDGGRRPDACGVINPSDVMVLTEQSRQRVEQQNSGDLTVGQKSMERPQCFSASFYGEGWGSASVRSSTAPSL